MAPMLEHNEKVASVKRRLVVFYQSANGIAVFFDSNCRLHTRIGVSTIRTTQIETEQLV